MTTLARKLRAVDYFALGWGSMVGVGWLVVMDDWLLRGGTLGAILGFAVGGALLLPIGFVYGRLVAAIPDAAAEIAYTARVFPQPVSFATGWMMFLAYFIVCPWEAVAIGRIAGYIFPALDSMVIYRIAGRPVYLPDLVIGLGLTALLTGMNYRGIRLSATFQNWATFGTLALFLVIVAIGVSKGSPRNFLPLFTHSGFVSVLLVMQIVPYFMTGFESVVKGAEEARPEFKAHQFFTAIWMAIAVGILFYTIIIAAVGYVAPWHQLTNDKFMTAVAFERAVGSRWIVSLILAAALLSLLKVFNGNLVAASRVLFAMGRGGLIDQRVGAVHVQNRTPSVAVVWVGMATAACMFLGDAILVPVTEVGSVASAIGWLGTCAAYYWMRPKPLERAIAMAGVVVSLLMILMKVVPAIPGHFNSYEWLALGIWSLMGATLALRARNFERRSYMKGSFGCGPWAVLLVVLAALLLCLTVPAQMSSPRSAFDLVITNGHIIDGTGSPWYSGDVGIRDGRIAAIGNLSEAARTRTIDAHGEVVAPGFIDMLGQSELTIQVDPRVPSKIYQGITTEITGEGNSAGPLNDAIIAADRATYDHYHLNPDWRTLGEYFGKLERQGIGINLASYVGATQVRRMVLGDDDKQPSPAQLEQMKGMVRQAMQEGAVGVSTALEYAPAPYAKTEELIALASEASKLGGIYATHMRNESDAVIPAIDEAVRIGREAHIPVEIWHIKVAGKENWGRMPEVVARINAARAQGIDVSANTYAYPAWFNNLSAFVPQWAHDGGDAKLVERLKDPAARARMRKDMETPSTDWDNEWQEIPGPESVLIGVVQNPKLLPLQGKTLAEIAKLWNKDPMDTLFDLLIEDKAFTYVAVFGMSEPDIALALQQPWVSIDNDSEGTSPEGILGQEHPHPRAYGTFPRILRKYVREEKKLALEDAIRKFSALPAQRMRFTDRGVLKQGMWADIVIFDPATVRDLATFADPNQLSQGMEYVLVNGVAVIDLGKMTGARPGKVLRGPGYGAK